jgi:hypothetical protein
MTTCCQDCGATRQQDARFCTACGRPIVAAQRPTGTLRPETIQLFAGRGADHYLRTFSRMYPDGSMALKPSWNWAAFLFGAFWLLYRGLLLETLAIWGVVGAFGLAHVPLWPLAVIGQGIFGDALYFLALQRRVRRAALADRRASAAEV